MSNKNLKWSLCFGKKLEKWEFFNREAMLLKYQLGMDEIHFLLAHLLISLTS